jgi:hypothetical protein
MVVVAAPEPPKLADTVTAPVVPPPLNPVPAVTPVMSPPLSVSAAQAHPAPVHFRSWLSPQLVTSPRDALPLVAPPVSPPPTAATTSVMSPPLSASAEQAQAEPFHFATWPAEHPSVASRSSSTSSAKPAGLAFTPDQGTASALGVGLSSCRPDSVVKVPPLAPGRTPISMKRASPGKAAAPKSSETVNRPEATATSSTTSGGSSADPPAGTS